MYIRLTSKVRELTDDAQRRMKDAEKKAVEMFDRKSGRVEVNTDKVEFFEEEDSDYVVAVYHSGESMLVTDTIEEIEKLINK